MKMYFKAINKQGFTTYFRVSDKWHDKLVHIFLKRGIKMEKSNSDEYCRRAEDKVRNWIIYYNCDIVNLDDSDATFDYGSFYERELNLKVKGV